jgi:hypothetical protein
MSHADRPIAHRTIMPEPGPARIRLPCALLPQAQPLRDEPRLGTFAPGVRRMRRVIIRSGPGGFLC